MNATLNAAALALLPIHTGPDDQLLVGDTIACTRQKLSRPTVYTDDGADFKPRIGVVVETTGHLVAILWDEYRAPWDYATRELQGTTRRISRATPAKVWPRGYSRPVPAAYRDKEGWVVLANGDQVSPTELGISTLG